MVTPGGAGQGTGMGWVQIIDGRTTPKQRARWEEICSQGGEGSHREAELRVAVMSLLAEVERLERD